MNGTPFDADKSKGFYELLTICVGIPASLCVVLGYITKHAYHASLGVRGLPLTIMEYAKTGALVEFFIIAPLVGLVVMGIFACSIWQEFKEQFPVFFFSLETGKPTHEVPRVFKFVARGVMLSLLFGFTGACLLTIYGLYRGALVSDWGKVWLSGTVVATGLLFLAHLVTMGGRDSRQRLALALLALVVTAVFAAVHAAFFGHTVYARVPGYLAGGAPHSIRLTLKDDPQTMRFALSRGLVLGEGDTEVDEVRLVEESADGYLVSVNEIGGEGRLIFIDRGMVHNAEKN